MTFDTDKFIQFIEGKGKNTPTPTLNEFLNKWETEKKIRKKAGSKEALLGKIITQAQTPELQNKALLQKVAKENKMKGILNNMRSY